MPASCHTPNWSGSEISGHQVPMSLVQDIAERVRDAAAAGSALCIEGGGSKRFYGHPCSGASLAVCGHTGIIDYTPSELVVSARAGTPLAELEAVLGQQGQMLAFEPPHCGTSATLGGSIACGLSGPRRPWSGAARDFVLGVTCINGKGDLLRFGGQVMKNVAGYDLSRTLTGSLGTLAVLLDIHLKVLPRPEHELTLARDCNAATAIEHCSQWAGLPLPLSGACHFDGRLYLRLSGSHQGVQAAAAKIGGDHDPAATGFWEDLREQRLAFFAGDRPLWRISVPPASAPLELDGDWLLDWGGAQRWLRSALPAEDIRRQAATAGGHATLFRGGDRTAEIFHPLPPALLGIHRQLKHSFDPAGILNPGRMYPDL
jgi:glycolate oxidase FAD binding subunit